MSIHVFGSMYGIAASIFFKNKSEFDSRKSMNSYNSCLFAFIGSIFLWVYWPSFNAVLAIERMEIVVVNTIFALGASCFTAACVSRILYSKLEIEIILNATLSGGVAIAASADLIEKTWISLVIGLAAGLLSIFSFKSIASCLSKNLSIHDTCGVSALHGIPGVFGVLASALVIVTQGIYNDKDADLGSVAGF